MKSGPSTRTGQAQPRRMAQAPTNQACSLHVVHRSPYHGSQEILWSIIAIYHEHCLSCAIRQPSAITRHNQTIVVDASMIWDCFHLISRRLIEIQWPNSFSKGQALFLWGFEMIFGVDSDPTLALFKQRLRTMNGELKPATQSCKEVVVGFSKREKRGRK